VRSGWRQGCCCRWTILRFPAPKITVHRKYVGRHPQATSQPRRGPGAHTPGFSEGQREFGGHGLRVADMVEILKKNNHITTTTIYMRRCIRRIHGEASTGPPRVEYSLQEDRISTMKLQSSLARRLGYVSALHMLILRAIWR